MSSKKKVVLTRNRFNKPDEVNNYVKLGKYTSNPACLMCKYQWYEKHFQNNRVGVWC